MECGSEPIRQTMEEGERIKKEDVRAFDTEMRVLIGHDRREGEESAERCVAFRAWKWTGRKYAEYRQKCDN